MANRDGAPARRRVRAWTPEAAVRTRRDRGARAGSPGAHSSGGRRMKPSYQVETNTAPVSVGSSNSPACQTWAGSRFAVASRPLAPSSNDSRNRIMSVRVVVATPRSASRELAERLRGALPNGPSARGGSPVDRLRTTVPLGHTGSSRGRRDPGEPYKQAFRAVGRPRARSRARTSWQGTCNRSWAWRRECVPTSRPPRSRARGPRRSRLRRRTPRATAASPSWSCSIKLGS